MRFAAPLAAALVAAPPAFGQAPELEGPLRFLKPWLKGLQQANPAAPEAAAAVRGDSGTPVDSPVSAAAPDSALPTEQLAPLPDVELSPEATAALPASTPEVGGTPQVEPELAEPAEPAIQPLRLAILAGRDVAAKMAALGPMETALTASIGRPVDFLPMASYGAMIEAQALGRIDGGFYSAAAFATAQARCRCLEPLAAPRAFDGSLAYHAVLVAGRSSGIGSMADLKGRRVATGSGDSLGSRRMQMAALLALGIDPEADLGTLQDAGSAEAAVLLVAAGEADAAFAWSSLSGDLVQGYSRGTLADLVRSGEIAMADFAVIWHSPPIAHGPAALASAVPDSERAAVKAHLLALEGTDPAAYDALNPYYSGGYAAIGPEDYAGVMTLVGEAAAEAAANPGRSPRE